MLEAHWDFNPRSPRGERLALALNRREILHISIHAPREGSDLGFVQSRCAVVISIHAPREGSDDAGQRGAGGGVISIHAPREGSDVIAFHAYRYRF